MSPLQTKFHDFSSNKYLGPGPGPGLGPGPGRGPGPGHFFGKNNGIVSEMGPYGSI